MRNFPLECNILFERLLGHFVTPTLYGFGQERLWFGFRLKQISSPDQAITKTIIPLPRFSLYTLCTQE